MNICARHCPTDVEVLYVHDDSESVEDSFTIQLTDGRHRVLKQVMVKVLQVNDEKPRLIRWDQHVYSRRRIDREKQKWTLYRSRVIRNTGLDVEPGETRLISSVSLFAQDRDTPPSELMYIFESVPTQGLLQLKVSYHFIICVKYQFVWWKKILNVTFLHNKSEAGQTSSMSRPSKSSPFVFNRAAFVSETQTMVMFVCSTYSGVNHTTVHENIRDVVLLANSVFLYLGPCCFFTSVSLSFHC